MKKNGRTKRRESEEGGAAGASRRKENDCLEKKRTHPPPISASPFSPFQIEAPSPFRSFSWLSLSVPSYILLSPVSPHRHRYRHITHTPAPTAKGVRVRRAMRRDHRSAKPGRIMTKNEGRERETHTHTHHVDDDGIRRLCCWTVVEVKADAPPASASNAYPNLIVIIIIYLLYIVTSASFAPPFLMKCPML